MNATERKQYMSDYKARRRAEGYYDTHYTIRDRCAAELARRRSKPNPQARPAASASPALVALRKSLARCTEPALRERLQASIAYIEGLHAPAKREKRAVN